MLVFFLTSCLYVWLNWASVSDLWNTMPAVGFGIGIILAAFIYLVLTYDSRDYRG